MIAPLLEAILQAWIIFTSIVALILLSREDDLKRFGYVVGLLGQPAWLFSTLAHGQVGMFFVSIAFTAVYGWGVWKHWIAPKLGWPVI